MEPLIVLGTSILCKLVFSCAKNLLKAISMKIFRKFIPFVDTYNYVYVCNVHTSTVISFIRSSKFVYIVYVIT